MKTKCHVIFMIAFLLIIQIEGFGQIVLENSDFESDLYCDPSDCEDSDISCIDGWWNHNPGGDWDQFAWIYYADYFDCSETNLDLTSCGDERGILLAAGTGSLGVMYPATNNPFLNEKNSGAYELKFNINVIEYIGALTGVYVKLYGDSYPTEQISSTAELIGVSQVISNTDICNMASIVISDPEKVDLLTSFEYIYFVIDKDTDPFAPEPDPPAEPSLIAEAVMDNLSVCRFLDIDISLAQCGQICVNLTSDCGLICDEDRYYDPELDDCYMQVTWFDDQIQTGNQVDDECYLPYFGSGQCCIDAPEFGTYYAYIEFLTVNDEGPHHEFYEFEYEYQDCLTTTVTSSSTSWGAGDIPPFARYELITVNSGATLTIEDDLVLRFCEDGKLVIKPGGVVILNGVLTSSCNAGWKGVEVQGNGTTNQWPSGGLFPQGRLFCNPESLIENALTAVKLYGPTINDTGGQIYAEGAYFTNNSRGLDFFPYKNYFPTPGKQKRYFSTIRNCIFDITEGYVTPWRFNEHIRMYGIFGIDINGTTFGNHRPLESATRSTEYGIGILAIDAGFNVGLTAVDQGNEPCLPTMCEIYNKSSFYGLGMGVFAGRITDNRPFQVYGAEFSNCYFGIGNYSVSGCNILLNQFNMGEIQDLVGVDDDQVGIGLSSYMAGMTIEGNQFILNGELADHSIGIAADYLGDMNNGIRKNKFVGLTVGNEAMGRNANSFSSSLPSGLNYTCNENIDVSVNDFYVPEAEMYLESIIRKWQRQYPNAVSSGYTAAGNKFSSSGDPIDGDFGNYGDETVNYFYDDNDLSQIPIDFSGINLVTESSNACSPSFCLAPCLNSSDFSSKVDAFYTNKNELKDALIEEDIELAAAYQLKLDSNSFNILRYVEYDTTDYKLDTLRAWYARIGSIACDILLAGSFCGSGTFTHVNKTIDSIPSRFDLEADQVVDLRRLKYAYGILSARSVFSLTSTDYDSLTLFSEGIGASSNLARSILAVNDSIYSPRYYIPGEISPRSVVHKKDPRTYEPKISVFPNPVCDALYVEVPKEMGSNLELIIFDLSGKVISTFKIHNGTNYIDLSNKVRSMSNGFYLYQIKSETSILANGKLIYIE